MVPLPGLLLLASLAALPAPISAPAVPPAAAQARLDLTPDGRLADLHDWTDRFRRGGHRVLRRGWRGELTALVVALRGELGEAGPERRDAILFGLLDLAGVVPAIPPREEAERTLVEDVHAIARRQLEAELRADPDEFLARWLAHEVLAHAASHPQERVLAAVRLLEGRYLESTQLALFSLVLGDDATLRAAAVDALVGWPSPLVDEVLAGRLVPLRERGDHRTVERIQAHFAASDRPPAGRAARALFEAAATGLRAEDWREALRTLDLTAVLPDGLAVPALIDGLEAWLDRRARGLGRRRVEAAIAAQLEQRSGRRMGAHPDRWRTWWRAVLSGEAETAGLREAAGPSTRAGFFGLRPETDRVVFVIDRSRSMSFAFGTSERTRFDEAIDQLSSFLEQLGPEARFRLVLFDDDVVESSRELREASPSQIAAAGRWMRAHGPRGGTMLRPGVEAAMRLDARGRLDPERLEADTVIVLCDGETGDGTAWIAPLLETVNRDARLVFHCVQIGGGSSGGALETLAAQSGGQFLEFQH